MRHSERVAEAVQRWRDELAALGGRDPLLSFRDLKVGTLDLAAAEPETRLQLMDGEQVLLSRLFPHEPLRSSALRSTRAIRDKSRELFEERGIRTCLLAIGIATWSNPFVAHRPTAPVLLRTATVVARDPAETDFVISVADDPTVNPVLLHALDTQLGLRFQADDLRDHSGQLTYPTVVERLREFAPAHVVDGFSIAHRAVLATFSVEPLLLGRDVEDLSAELEQQDVIAALAGDDDARLATRAHPIRVPPEYLSFDTDTDQHNAIAAAAGGGSILVDAPPGSGRTQTVAGLVAELVGRGQRVLVVSPKRATLDDLVTRLRSAGLGEIVLDLGPSSPTEAADHITEATRRLRAGPKPHPAVPDHGADDLRADLDEYRDALQRTREPWNVSAYDAMVATATTPDDARTAVRISAEPLERMGSATDLGRRLREYAELEGLTLTKEGSPWYGADVSTSDSADALATTVTGLRDTYVPQLRDTATRAAVEVGLAGPSTIAECFEVVELLSAVERTVAMLGPALWNEPLDDLAAATGTRAERGVHASQPGFLARRRLRRRATELSGRSGRGRREALHAQLVAARDQLAQWKERCRDGKLPRTGQYLPRAVEAVSVAKRRLAVLREANPRTADLPEVSFAEAGRRLNALVLDERHLRALPRLTTLQAELGAAGLDDLLADLRRRQVRPDRVEQVLQYARLASLLDHWRTTDTALRRFDGTEYRRKLEEFRVADEASVRSGAYRVLQARGARFAEACEEFAGQAEVFPGSAGAAAHDPPATPRTLLETAPDIVLSAVPCWVMSPLAVAGTLPPRQLFDVVIVEDAARVTPAEAVPSLGRASRAILVADDEVALPPFATAVEPAPDPDEQEGPWAGEPPTSVADALRDALPALPLRGQYRFRDDRLVGFAAQSGYAGRLTTVPGAGGNERVTLELVDAPIGGDDPVDSSSSEVNRVVELVLEHLRARPHESLGIVTLGPRHAERLDAALRRALVRAPDVASLLHEDRAEPFFVKDVERVAGDVRDAIILSLGYGRSVDGRILYRFGALGRPGGERRLMSASTRARERLTVVSTFGADDLSPRRLTTPGAQALGDFLAYVESRARAQTDEPTPGGDAFAMAVVDRLGNAGIAAEVGYGGAGGVAVAVRHPTRSDRFVLAVETDAPDGAAARSTRERERIRPAVLQQLGWTVYKALVEEWATDPEAEAKRLVQACEDAVAAADAYDWAVAAAEADVVAGMPDESGLEDDAADDAPATPPGSDEASATAAETGAVDDGVPEPVSEDGQDGQDGYVVPGGGAYPQPKPGRTISDYSRRELAAVARRIESDGARRREEDVVDRAAVQLQLPMDDARTRDVLRHAVRIARAGFPPPE